MSTNANIRALANAVNMLSKRHATLRGQAKEALTNLTHRFDKFARARKADVVAEVAREEVAAVIDSVRHDAERQIAYEAGQVKNRITSAIHDARAGTRRALTTLDRQMRENFRATAKGLCTPSAVLPWALIINAYERLPEGEPAISSDAKPLAAILCVDAAMTWFAVRHGDDLVAWDIERPTTAELVEVIPWACMYPAYRAASDGGWFERGIEIAAASKLASRELEENALVIVTLRRAKLVR